MEGAEPEAPPEAAAPEDQEIVKELGNDVYSLTGVDDAVSKPEAAPSNDNDDEAKPASEHGEPEKEEAGSDAGEKAEGGEEEKKSGSSSNKEKSASEHDGNESEGKKEKSGSSDHEEKAKSESDKEKEKSESDKEKEKSESDKEKSESEKEKEKSESEKEKEKSESEKEKEKSGSEKEKSESEKEKEKSESEKEKEKSGSEKEEQKEESGAAREEEEVRERKAEEEEKKESGSEKAASGDEKPGNEEEDKKEKSGAASDSEKEKSHESEKKSSSDHEKKSDNGEEQPEHKSGSAKASSSSSSSSDDEGSAKKEEEAPAPTSDVAHSDDDDAQTKPLDEWNNEKAEDEKPEEDAPQEEEQPPPKPVTTASKGRREPVKGMTVKDDYKPPTIKSPRSIPGEIAIAQLPPLATDPDKDAESERMLKKFRDRGIVPAESDLRAQLQQYIQRQKVNSLCKNKFTEAAKYQELARKLTQAIEQAGSKDMAKQRLEVLQQKLSIAREKVVAFEVETKRLLKEEAEKQKQKKYALEEQQDEELGAFEDKWNDQEFLAKFAKPSGKLLALKKTERSLILAKDFEKAEGYKTQVEELEKEESENAQVRAKTEMKQQYQRLLQKHENERTALAASSQKAIELLQHDRETQLTTLTAVQTKIQNQIDEMKSSRAAPLPPLKPIRSRSATQELFPQEVMTPRTAQRLALYKARMTQPKVIVRPLGSISRRGRRRNNKPGG